MTENLLKNLSLFGLNPLDWNLVSEKRGVYRIIHRRENGFTLKGRACSRQGTWKDIWLETF